MSQRPAPVFVNYPRPNPGAPLRLFCLPYAGGGPTIYWPWAKALPALEVCPVGLPGRGTLLNLPPHTSVGPLVAELARAMQAHLDKPFALFGHSMGALVAFELARELRRSYGRLPAALIVGGRNAPHWPRENRPDLHGLPDAELVAELKVLGGTPPEVLAHAELMELILPVMRADLAIHETYEYVAEAPLACPVVALGGTRDDRTTQAGLEAWGELTTGRFALEWFEGGHFFVHETGLVTTAVQRHLL
ncbi:MAG TPA: alpha/beta fold hydrolase [Symbiobacteriaceae bacterium]|nr:alpha/beta fold hydrolase [Symbiobacteriaceae bacterium]